MAECSICLPLNEAQLEVVKRVLGLQESPVVQLTAVHKTDHVIRYGMIPPGEPHYKFHPLYLVDIPDPLRQMRVFFTDAQKKQMRDEGIEPCDYVEVEPVKAKLDDPKGVRYGILLPHNMKYAIPTPPAKAGD